MAWYYLIYVLVLAAVSSVLIRNEAWRHALLKYYLPLLGLVTLVFVVCRTSSVDHDYQDYLYWFNSIVPESLSDIRWNHDPMFFLTSWLATATGLSYKAVLAVYSSLAIIFVYVFSRKVRDDRWLTVLLYITFCHFFIEYEMTAIRAAVAIPLAAISLLLAQEKKVVQSILVFVLALGFHLSILLVLPVFIVFHCRLKLESRLWMFALIPFGIVAYVVTTKALPLFMLYDRLAVYSKQNTDLTPVPLLSIYLVARIISLGIVLGFCWKNLSIRDRHIVLCSGISLLLFLSLSSWDTLAWRASEIFGLFDMAVFLIPLAYFKNTFRAVYLVALIGLGFEFYRSSLQLVAPYSF
jgi:hypothetical protein